MTSRNWSWLTVAIAGAVISIGCHGREAVERHSAQTQERHPVDAASVAAPGVVEPWGGEVRLASLESGVLASLAAAEGQLVKKGELLARLEDSTQRHAVDLAEAEVRAASAELDGASSRPEEIRVAEADLAAATARLARQDRETERTALLGKSGAVAAAEVEQASSSLQLDEAAERSARARLDLARRGARPSVRKVAAARLQAAEARLASARALLERREVRSTIDAIVIWSRNHVGEFYSQTQGPLLVLGDLERLQVRLEVDDVDAAALEPNVRCTLRDDNGAPIGEGALTRIAIEYGSRSLGSERPTDRTDSRIREAFLETSPSATLSPGRRVWGYCPRRALQARR